jgi:hypothetical protein
METPEGSPESSPAGVGSQSDPATTSPIVPGQRATQILPNSREQREGLQDLADLLRTVSEYFRQKDVQELANRAELWSQRVRSLLERAEREATAATDRT